LSIKCDICGSEFHSKRSLVNHRRWHDLPEYEEFKKKYHKSMSKAKTGSKNPNWKGGISENKYSDTVCDICGKDFENTHALSSHRRWHNLPEFKSFQELYKEKLSKANKGRIFSEETLKKMSESRKGKLTGADNPNWKGDNVGYHSLHVWVRKYKPQPKACENCGTKKDYLELANISGEYKRDIKDYKYLCVKCHKEFDGVLERFIESGKKTRFKKGHETWNKGISGYKRNHFNKEIIEKIKKG